MICIPLWWQHLNYATETTTATTTKIEPNKQLQNSAWTLSPINIYGLWHMRWINNKAIRAFRSVVHTKRHTFVIFFLFSFFLFNSFKFDKRKNLNQIKRVQEKKEYIIIASEKQKMGKNEIFLFSCFTFDNRIKCGLL